MADVEQRAEAEASAKGLEGGARRAYVGGVFNRIRQAHARATTPGKGAALLNRKKRVAASLAWVPKDLRSYMSDTDWKYSSPAQLSEHDRARYIEELRERKRDKPFWDAVKKNEHDNATMIHRDAELTAQIQRDEQRRGINRGMARRREKAKEAGTSIGGQRKPAPAATAPQAKATGQAGAKGKAKPAAMAAPATKVVKPKLVFGKPPKEPQPKREPGSYTPKAQALVDAYWREHEAERAGKKRPHTFIGKKYVGDPEHELWLYDKAQHKKFQEEKFARLAREEEEGYAERKKLEAFKDNSLVTRAQRDPKAKAELEATRQRLREQDEELTRQINALNAEMHKRVWAQRDAERAGDTATAERLKKEALNIAQGAAHVGRQRHALRVRRDNLLDSSYLKL